MADRMALAAEERRDFADLLETLTPDQWHASTLCNEWDEAVLLALAGRSHALDDLDGPGLDVLSARLRTP